MALAEPVPTSRSHDPRLEAAGAVPASRSHDPPLEAAGAVPASRSHDPPLEAAGAVPASRLHLPSFAAVRPVMLAGERRLAVPGPLGALLPGGGLQRGVVVAVDGATGAGATSLVLQLVAAATAAGEWAAAIDLANTFGALAAAEAGVALERLAVVRRVAPGRWGRVVATLLDGVTLVAAAVPDSVRPSDARRLTARARERAAVLVTAGPWPGEAALRLRAEASTWDGLGRGEGLLRGRVVRVAVSGRGAAGQGRVAELAAFWPAAS